MSSREMASLTWLSIPFICCATKEEPISANNFCNYNTRYLTESIFEN